MNVEADAAMVGSAAGRAVNVVITPVAEGAEVVSEAAGVAVPACGGVGVGISASSSPIQSLIYMGVHRQSVHEAWGVEYRGVPP